MEIDYRTYFKDWKNWETFEPYIDPPINGVYAFRLTHDFGRLLGTSSLLYIGKADQDLVNNQNPGIYFRLRNYRQNNGGSSKRLKVVEKYFGGKSQIEYAYCQCEFPLEIERMLLENYYLQHLELPPINRAAKD